MSQRETTPDPATRPDTPTGGRDTEPLPPDELDFWGRAYATQEVSAEQAGEPHLLFRLGDERFALPMADLDEVASLASGVALPHTGPLVHGLANLRGEVVLLLDTARALEADAAPRLGRDNRTLVIKDRDGRRTGLMVDALDGVVTLDPGLFDLPALEPATDQPIRRAGSAEFRDGTLFLVDTAPLREARLSHF